MTSRVRPITGSAREVGVHLECDLPAAVLAVPKPRVRCNSLADCANLTKAFHACTDCYSYCGWLRY